MCQKFLVVQEVLILIYTFINMFMYTKYTYIEAKGRRNRKFRQVGKFPHKNDSFFVTFTCIQHILDFCFLNTVAYFLYILMLMPDVQHFNPLLMGCDENCHSL